MYYFKLFCFFGNSEAKSSAHNSLKWPGLGFASFYAGFCAVFASLPWWRVTSALSDLASKSTHATICGTKNPGVLCWSVVQKLKIVRYFQFFFLKILHIKFNLDICPPSSHTQPSAVKQ